MIMIENFKKIRGFGIKDSIFYDYDHENTLEFEIMIACLPGENMKHLL